MKGKGWRESPDHSGKAPIHSRVARTTKLKDTLRKPISIQGSTAKFKKALSKLLSNLEKEYSYDTTITEFRRWLKEDLMSFDQAEAQEQIAEKIDYEKELGNNSKVFHNIERFITNWVAENVKQSDPNIWYHGTTEGNYNKILQAGMIKPSTTETAQHKDFASDIGTISLAKHKRQAHFFSGLSGLGKQNQIILHIDISKLDPSGIKKRTLISSPEAEILYNKPIPTTAIVNTETVFTKKNRV